MCQTCETMHPTSFAHKWERPLVRLAAIATFGAIALGFWAMAALDETTIDDQPWLLSGPFVVLLIPVIFVSRYILASRQRANSVRVSAGQLPDVWEIYSDLLERFSLPAAPSLYIQNGNGEVNAFAFSCSNRRNYVILNSEIALLARDHPDIVRFVLAHELAHHKLGHVKFRRLALSLIMDMMYLPGKALSRAQEYSADRLALAVCPGTADSLVLLATGPWLVKQTSPDALWRQAIDEENSFGIRITNAMQTHPVFTKRFGALKKIEQSGFSNHGPLF